MLNRLKSISMMLLLLGFSSGVAYAVGDPSVTDVKITQQNGKCTGIVKDATGETIIGASVLVKGTSNGAITGLDGDFTLNNVKHGDVIQISFIGYVTQEITWNGQLINVILKEDSQTLEEVVVVGYGTQKKVNLTGAVAAVDGEVLESRPITNIGQGFIIRKSKFPQNPKRSVRFSGKRTKRSVQKRKARNTQKAETKVL